MRKKSIFVLVLVMITAFLTNIFLTIYKIEEIQLPSLDRVDVNDIVQSVIENWDALDKKTKELSQKYEFDFTIIDNENKVRAKTDQKLNEDLNTAISHRDTIVDIYDDNEIKGKIIIYNEYNKNLLIHKKNFITACLIMNFIILLYFIGFIIILYIKIYRPFNKLQRFAKNVAAGDLDLPIEMDKKHIFGAFTESFDLMREELKLAREAEKKANISKKELVAQLSHDIKTPVASIKAVSELLEAQSIKEKDIYHLQTIGNKADQINTLITNMFNATLEELQELNVESKEQKSSIIDEIINYADYLKKVQKEKIKECLIYADKNRLTQIIDNIISNSYKYADTDIIIKSYFNKEYLFVEFRDFGSGVKAIELPLLLHKFYRAENSKGKAGSGLGLYTSCYFMNQMKGDIFCENTKNGFKTTIVLKLV